MDPTVVRSLKNVPLINGWPPEQQTAFYHGIASVLEAMGMQQLAQEFAPLRDQGMQTGSLVEVEQPPYDDADFIG